MDEAVQWACTIVADAIAPSEEVVELAGAIRPHPVDVIAMLRRIPGSSDPVRVFRQVLARARDFLRATPNAWPQVTRALEQMAIEGVVPEPVAGPCYCFDDERLLAEHGTYGNLEDVHAELLRFLTEEAEEPAATPE